MNPKTVSDESISINTVDPLEGQQREDVAKMRASLLACATTGNYSIDTIKDITTRQIFHQLSRVIRYLDMMDKIESKLYQCIDNTLDTIDVYDTSSLITLLGIQERLQRSMIESQKLLEPYMSGLNIEEVISTNFNVIDASDEILDRAQRDKIRDSAQQVLTLVKGL